MDSLRLSYTEVMDIVPYRTLLIMMRDKMHPVNGEVLEEVTDDVFFSEKGIKFDG